MENPLFNISMASGSLNLHVGQFTRCLRLNGINDDHHFGNMVRDGHDSQSSRQYRVQRQ